jgi:hypothetical protein
MRFGETSPKLVTCSEASEGGKACATGGFETC